MGIKHPKLYLAISLTILFFMQYFWLTISPDALIVPKEFYQISARNIGFIFLLFILSYLAAFQKFSAYFVPLPVTVALLIIFDSVFTFLYFKDQIFPQQAKVTESPAGPGKSFISKQFPWGILDYNRGFGYANAVNDTVRVELTVNDKRLPDVFYITDHYGRRINTTAIGGPKERYALFLGCSVTFGQNVADSCTLPAYFEKINPEYHSYNYGIIASGPHQYLAMFEYENVADQIPEKQGIAIYSFFENHVNRAIGDYQTYLWNGQTPYFTFSEGELVQKGDFKKGRPVLSSFFDLLSESYFIKYIHFNYPEKLTENQYELTAAIIARTRDLYVNQFGNDDFYVLLLPGFETKIVPYLHKHQLKIMDYRTSIPEFWSGSYTFPIDNHPNGLTYSILADSISVSLKAAEL